MFLLALPLFLYIIVKEMIAAAEELFDAAGGASGIVGAGEVGGAVAGGVVAGAVSGAAVGAAKGSGNAAKLAMGGRPGQAAKSLMSDTARGAWHGAKHGATARSANQIPGAAFKGAEQINAKHNSENKSDQASKASGVAAATGSPSDHSAAAQAHSEASQAAKAAGDTDKATYHSTKAKEHSELSQPPSTTFEGEKGKTGGQHNSADSSQNSSQNNTGSRGEKNKEKGSGLFGPDNRPINEM